jgi:integration host factor subunit beta
MTRSELILLLAERFPQLVQKDAEMAVTEILGAIHAALLHGDRIEIRGFGSFCLNYRASRQARNPKTGEPVTVSAKWVPAFKAGKELRERVMVMATASSPRSSRPDRDTPSVSRSPTPLQREPSALFKDGIG